MRIHFGLALLVILLVSCGKMMNDKPPGSASVGSQITSSTCKINGSKLKKFAEVDVSVELRCIQSNLQLYSAVNQISDPSYLNKNELTLFIRKFLPSAIKDIEGIGTLFVVNYLIYGGERERIKLNEIPRLFEFLIQLNKSLIPVYEAFKWHREGTKKSESEYKYYKEKAMTGFNDLSDIVKKNIKKHENTYGEISTNSIINLINKNGSNQSLIDQGLKFRKLKVVLLGGNQDIYTFKEIVRLLTILPTLGSTVLDLLLYPKLVFNSDHNQMSFILGLLDGFEKSLYYEGVGSNKNYSYFTVSDLIEISKSIESNPYDLVPITKSIKKIKQKFLKTDSDWFSYQDLIKIIGHSKAIIEKIVYFQEMWKKNETLLGRPVKVRASQIISFDPKNRKLNKSFKKIVATYRHIPEEKGFSSFDHAWVRSKRGVIEVGVIEYIVEMFLGVYGSGADGRSIKLSDFQKIIDDYQDFVVEMNFYRNPISQMLGSQKLMADYFRGHSNGNGVIDFEEIVGIILMDMASFHVAEKAYDGLEKKCRGDYKCEEGRFKITQLCPAMNGCNPGNYKVGVPTKFYYENFFKSLLPYRKNFPALFSASDTWKLEGKIKFARAMSKFSRHCPFDSMDEKPQYEVSVTAKDIALIIGGLVSIEETFIRFDKDANHVFGPNELEAAFNHFKPAIYTIIDKEISIFENWKDYSKSKVARTLFYYLIINGEIPRKPVKKDRFGRIKPSSGKINPWPLLKYYLGLGAIIKYYAPRPDRLDFAKVLTNLSMPDTIPNTDCYLEKVFPR